MRKRVPFLIALILVAVVSGPASPALAGETSLVTILMEALGVTNAQAAGGAGALFNLAETKLSAEDFGKVAAAVPEMDQLKRAAPASAGLGDMLGGVSSAFGGGGGTAGGLASLAGSFSKLGLDPAMVDQFVPVILDYVETNGGAAVKSLLQSALL